MTRSRISNPDELGCLHQPQLLGMLRSLNLDVAYHRCEGDFLYYFNRQGEEVGVLDMVGGYGSLLLGHAHPEILAEAKRILDEQRPHHAQGSVRTYASILAEELSRRAGRSYTAIFANTGSEAVEAAMQHAMLETGFHTFLTLEGAYHGKTLGARQLSSRSNHPSPVGSAVVPTRRVRLNDFQDLEAAFETTDEIAGFFLEPIQGEAGVRLIDPEFARLVAKYCSRRGVPLIVDECQTGMGRTGSFLGSEALGIEADYIILSKTLGGGLAKVSAVLISRSRYCDRFDEIHTSTYAADDYSCAIALKTLELVDDDTLAECRDKGERLLAGFRELKVRYGGVIRDVRGRGLMIGIELGRFEDSPSFLLRILASQKRLLHALMGYLHHEHQIRVATTLSDPFTMRLQPSALIDLSQIDRLLDAFDQMCRKLAEHDAAGLTQYLLEGNDEGRQAPVGSGETTVTPFDPVRFPGGHASSETGVAWLFHLLDADDLSRLEPSLVGMTPENRRDFVERFSDFADPVVMSSVTIRSQTGDAVRLYPILLPITSSQIKGWIDGRQQRRVRPLVQRGIEVACRLGCDVVSLGQYTSIVTNNGKSLDSLGMGLTTGNSYATSLVIQAIRRAHLRQGSRASDSVLAIVGASGNIGRICAEILAPDYRKTILVGRRNSSEADRSWFDGNPAIVWTDDIRDVKSAQVVVAAVNSVDMPLRPELLAEHCLVCDVSIPSCLPPMTQEMRPDLTIINGGIVALPFGEDLEIAGFPLATGKAYGCLAEGVLLGLEQIRDRMFTGSLTVDHILRVEEIAQRHGFELSSDGASSALGSLKKNCHVEFHT